MLGQGILLGLGLSMLVGPLIVALLEASLTQGFRAGIAVGGGIWISDALFILFTYLGLAYVEQLIDWPGFGLTLGLIGGLVLIAFGLGAVLFKPKVKMAGGETSIKSRPLSRWMLKGFLINTLNPFTVFFWTGVAGSVIASPDFKPADAFPFYAGVFGMIVLSDTLKVWLAKGIRKKIKSGFLQKLQKIAGIALLCFGILLIIRSIWFL
ncbi:MAG: LysE family transporter [Bacteroidetes bacterium]|nr:LysE family transporter [Bacteroidota bacterium]